MTKTRSAPPRRRMHAVALLAAGTAAGVIATAAIAARSATQPAGGPGGPPPGAQAGQDAGQDMGAMLIAGLKETPGCLGADAARTMSGRNAIFAWFENKEAATRWYYSQTHRRMMMMAGADLEPDHVPMAHVPDGVPLMVIATITPSKGDDAIEGFPMPISQISIELFQALPGGAQVNGRLSPQAFPVEHMRNYTEETAPGSR